MKLPKIREWIRNRILGLVTLIALIAFLIISLFVASINAPVGAQLFFTAVALMLIFYAAKSR